MFVSDAVQKIAGAASAVFSAMILSALAALWVLGAPIEQSSSHAEFMLSEAQEREHEWLAKAIYFESRGEGLEGQSAVAQAILNRAADARWPNTIEAVVRQDEHKRGKCQFSFMCDGEPEVIRDENAWALAQFIASREYFARLRGEATASCAHSYHATYSQNTSWFVEKLAYDRQVGIHVFYCDKKENA